MGNRGLIMGKDGRLENNFGEFREISWHIFVLHVLATIHHQHVVYPYDWDDRSVAFLSTSFSSRSLSMSSVASCGLLAAHL
jgi:hypothetical protein